MFQKEWLNNIFDLIPQHQSTKLLDIEGQAGYSSFLVKTIISQFIWIGGLLGIGLFSYQKADFK
jgi:hypothetical protein